MDFSLTEVLRSGIESLACFIGTTNHPHNRKTDQGWFKNVIAPLLVIMIAATIGGVWSAFLTNHDQDKDIAANTQNIKALAAEMEKQRDRFDDKLDRILREVKR